MKNTELQIEKYIKSKARGIILFPDDFMHFGTSVAIRKALQRLVEKNKVRRIAKGIYVRPKISKYLGEVLPTIEDIAKAIARRDRIKIIPTGTSALHTLGLSTQMPMKLVYLTDGAPREINIGNRSLKLKKTTPKNLLAKGKISGLVIQALKEIGKENLRQSDKKKIFDLLMKENPKNIAHDMQLAPYWIRIIMQRNLDHD